MRRHRHFLGDRYFLDNWAEVTQQAGGEARPWALVVRIQSHTRDQCAPQSPSVLGPLHHTLAVLALSVDFYCDPPASRDSGGISA